VRQEAIGAIIGLESTRAS